VRARLLLATGNAHKVAELAVILGDRYEVVAAEPGVEETGTSYEENALLKARAVRDASGALAVADDSGIEVDALGGAPGLRSARWAAGDEVGRLLAALDGVPADRRGCRYVCAAAVARPDGSEDVVRGTVAGVVAVEPRGTQGFGFDPLVVPVEGDGRTFAELAPTEKHAISHRARAFRALADRLGVLG
jgi:XTP/dITP diphosphohydrolase